MNIHVHILKKEGFTFAIALSFENGLELRTTKDLIWGGKQQKQEVVRQVKELLTHLQSNGFTIENPTWEKYV